MRAVIDFKGSWVIHMLREMMDDDDEFFGALRAYYEQYKYSNAATDDLRAAFEAAWGASLQDFFDQWVYSPAWPVYSVVMSSAMPANDGGYAFDVRIYQLQEHEIVNSVGTPMRDYYIMPIDITIADVDGERQTFTVLNTSRQQRFQLKSRIMPASVEIDADMNILREIDSAANPPQQNSLPSARAFILPLGKRAPVRVLLVGRGSDTDGTVRDYTWVVDNKQLVKGRFALVTLEEPGRHQIFLTVNDDMQGAGSSVPAGIEVQ